MDIYIDESGVFVPGSNKSSCVVALVIPTGKVREINKKFIELRKSWGHHSEIKGSSLNEVQISQVIDMLAQYHCFIDVCSLSMEEDEHAILEHKAKQAIKLHEHLNRNLSTTVVQNIHEHSARILSLSCVQYAQFMATQVLLGRLISDCLSYYAVRDQSEIGMIRWTFDSRANTAANPSHREISDVDSLIKCLTGDFIAYRRKLKIRRGYDYRPFFRSYAEDCDSVEETITRGEIPPVNKGKLFNQMSFRDSATHPCLQVVDIIASAVTRAMNNNLGFEGWESIGRLFIWRKDEMVLFKAFDLDECPSDGGKPPTASEDAFATHIRKKSQRLLVKDGCDSCEVYGNHYCQKCGEYFCLHHALEHRQNIGH